MPHSNSSNIIPFKPKHDQLLLEEIEEDNRTAGGLYIPDKFKNVLNMGKVLAKGPFCEAANCAIGEIVIFPMHTEHRMQFNGQWYIFLREADLLAGDECKGIAILQKQSQHIDPFSSEPTLSKGRKPPIGLNAQ